MRNEIRPFSEGVYSLMVLQGVKRMLKRSDYYLHFVPPSDVLRDTADSGEVQDALQYAIDAVRAQVAQERESEQR